MSDVDRVVRAEDLMWDGTPFDWCCEACGAVFHVGDVAHGQQIGRHAIGGWRCGRCHARKTPIPDLGLAAAVHTLAGSAISPPLVAVVKRRAPARTKVTARP